MTKNIDETLKKTNVENKKVSLKITKKNSSKNTKKVILETPILEKISKENTKKTIKDLKPEQNALGSLNVAQNKISRKSNTSLKSIIPTPNSQKNIQKLDTDQILVKPKRTLKLNIETTTSDTPSEIETDTILEDLNEKSEKKEISINQNSAFFYEPSIFEKFNIAVSNAEEELSSSILDQEISQNIESNLESNKPKLNSISEVSDEYDFISTETPDIYKTTYSFEDNIISDDFDDVTENNNSSFSESNIEDIVNLDTTLNQDKVALENINNITTDVPINNFFESSIPTTEDISASSNSVFKEFSYEKETASNSENEIIENVAPFAILNQADTNKQVIENLDNKENLDSNLEISLQPTTLVLPSTNETILNSQDTLDISENVLPNIITPTSNSNLEIDEANLSDEEIDKELDEVLGIENEIDDFSIEDYFGVTVSDKTETDDAEDIDDFVEEIDEQEDFTSSPSFPKLKQPDVTSFSKLIEGFTQTISTLSNKISDLEANIAENENNKKMRTDAYIENLLNSSIEDVDPLNLDDISLDDISLDDIDIDSLKIDNNDSKSLEENTNDITEQNQSVENILMKALDNSKIDNQMKQDLLTEVLSSNEVENVENDISSTPVDPDVTSDFFKVIDSLSKTISELENTSEKEIMEIPDTTSYNEKKLENSEKNLIEDLTDTSIENLIDEPVEESIIPISETEEKNEVQAPIVSTPETSSEKAINILINKDDIFSISIANESYEIVTDFDGISVLSENIHISTPKNNFYVNIGEKYIEIHKQPDLFVVNTNFEDIEFANAINNVTFAKKKNKIELNIKEAFKISSINKKIELSMLNTSIANLTNSQNASNENDDSSVCDNKTLVINEETQKVYLPYTIEEVMKKLHNSSDYQSIEDVIEQEYTLPLSTFKMPIISRFKEAYRFMRVKEKSSVYAALDLAVELMFNSNLNPAIIRAAKDLKELNIYLDCLYENELDKFDCFKIVYKVLPKIQ